MWAALAGFPRIGEILARDASISTHGRVALAAWPAIAAGVWWFAWRRAFPAPRGAIVRALSTHRTGMVGACGVALLVTAALLTPLLTAFDPTDLDLRAARALPTAAHPLGTDIHGRDLLARLLYGGRISLTIGLLGVAISAFVGTAVGAAAGYFGGMIDRALMWLVDLLLSLPTLLLLIAVVGLYGARGATVAVLAGILGLTAWMPVARVVRAEVLSLREREFVLAARAMGASDLRIVYRHILPNALAPVIVYCSLTVGGMILAEAALSFLGLGVRPPTPTWGGMVEDGRAALRTAPWIATLPGLAIAVSVMSFNLLGDGLRDALDPRLRR